MYKHFIKHWGICCILIFSLIPLLPLFHGGFFPIHDDTQVARVFEMGKSLGDNMIPVRWIQDLGYGYGYPIFTFYAPLAYYFGGLVMLGGVSALIATKVMMGVGILLSGIFMYVLAREIWGEKGGVLAGLFYLYAPYHALDIYVRGDVAEAWAYAFIPLAFLGIWKSYQTTKARYILLGGLGFAGIILSHNLTALMITPFILLFTVILLFVSKNLRLGYFILAPLGLGLLLSAFYWLPVPFEMSATNVLSQVTGGADFHKNFVCLSQLWNSPWGFGGSIPGCIDGISFALGKIYILFLFLACLLLPIMYRKDQRKGLIFLGSIIGVFASLFLVLSGSEFIWNSIHVMSFLQYPWRFLLVSFFFLSFLSGGVMWHLEQLRLSKKYNIGFISFMVSIAILVIVQGKYFTPLQYLSISSSFYTNTYALEWKTSRITDEYMPKGFHKPTGDKQIVSNRFILPNAHDTILSQSEKVQEKSLNVKIVKKGRVYINLAYFPGWHAFLDNQEVLLTPFPSGMFILIPQGTHHIVIAYIDTVIEQFGDAITLLSIVAIILVILIKQRRDNYDKKER